MADEVTTAGKLNSRGSFENFPSKVTGSKKTINNKRTVWLCFLRQEHIWIHKQPSLQAPKFYLNHHTSKMFKRGVSHVLHGNLTASLAAGALWHQNE